MSHVPAPRTLRVVSGDRASTARQAAALVQHLPVHAVLQVGGPADTPFGTVAPGRVRSRLGQAFDAVIVDLHEPLDADVLGVVHGLVWGGGALILRLPADGLPPPSPRLAVEPFTVRDVTSRMARRVVDRLPAPDARPIPAPSHHRAGTSEQARVVDALAARLGSTSPTSTALLADRGRGKSAALGLAAARLQATGARVLLTGPEPGAALEVQRFAPGLPFTPLADALRAPHIDVILVDEAARIGVPTLQALASAHPGAHLAFATTTHGYEGTGRGFVLRFLAWLEAAPRPVQQHTLHTPVRWAPDDPVERWAMDVLALDAAPAALHGPPDTLAAEARPVRLDRDRLARDEVLLREVFGLLVHAHYRTVPSDLHRLLDAPNLHVWALLHDGHALAVNLVAEEGGLDADRCAALGRGAERLRGQALADTLITHAGRPDLARLRLLRSVRLAVHPELRGRGLARRLVEHVEVEAGPDAIGTLFGATPELIRMRARWGYRLVRLGTSVGERTGVPSVVMLKPLDTEVAPDLAALQQDLARNLPAQLDLLTHEGAHLDPLLPDALRNQVPAAAPLDAAALEQRVARYLAGPQPADALIADLRTWVQLHPGALAASRPQDQALIRRRILDLRPWPEAAEAAGLPGARAAMRRMRPALAALAHRDLS